MLRRVISGRPSPTTQHKTLPKRTPVITSENYGVLGSSLIVRKVVHELSTFGTTNKDLNATKQELQAYLVIRATYAYQKRFNPEASNNAFISMLEDLNQAITILNNPNLEDSINQILEKYDIAKGIDTLYVLNMDEKFKSAFPYQKLREIRDITHEGYTKLDEEFYKIYVLSKFYQHIENLVSNYHIKEYTRTCISNNQFWPIKEVPLVTQGTLKEESQKLLTMFETDRSLVAKQMLERFQL